MLTMDPEAVNKGGQCPHISKRTCGGECGKKRENPTEAKKESLVLKHRTLHPVEK